MSVARSKSICSATHSLSFKPFLSRYPAPYMTGPVCYLSLAGVCAVLIVSSPAHPAVCFALGAIKSDCESEERLDVVLLASGSDTAGFPALC